MPLIAKKVEIFSGTGGVGKTTLATSRANFLAQQGHTVLLITIDPAKRLREVLDMQQGSEGEVHTIENLTGEMKYQFDVILMAPDETFKRLAQENKVPQILHNRILKVLSRPYGGLNEILSIVELHGHLKSEKYQHIILDTPPGPHFLDFLQSSERIRSFFDQSFVDIFQYLGDKNKERLNQSRRFVGMIVSTGIKRLLSYLEKVTGADFIEEFMDAVGSIYRTKESFLDALKIQQDLKKREFTNWFLVTSVEQSKFNEALELQQHASEFIHEDHFAIVNKSQESLWKNWQVDGDEHAQKLKTSFIEKEQELCSHIEKYFSQVIKFHEVLQSSPLEHVESLTEQWKQYVEQKATFYENQFQAGT